MKLSSLQCFYAITKQGNFKKAAEALGLSQGAVTMSIKNLEEELGVLLFDRSAKQVKLTKAGQIALVRVSSILGEIHELELMGSRIKEGNNRVRIAFAYDGDLCIRIAEGFTARYPEINVEIQQRNVQKIIPLLENDEYDIGITYSDFVTEEQQSIPLGQIEFGVFFPAGHEFESCKTVEAGALGRYQLLFPTLENKAEARVRGYFKENGVPLAIRKTIYAMDPQIASVLASHSGEIAILPMELREHMAGILARRLDPPLTMEQSAVWLKSKYINQGMDAMLKFLQEADGAPTV